MKNPHLRLSDGSRRSGTHCAPNKTHGGKRYQTQGLQVRSESFVPKAILRAW